MITVIVILCLMSLAMLIDYKKRWGLWLSWRKGKITTRKEKRISVKVMTQ